MEYEPDTERRKITLLIAQQNWRKLSQMGKPAVESLIGCLTDLDIVNGATDALVMIGEPAVMPLISCLKDAAPERFTTTEFRRYGRTITRQRGDSRRFHSNRAVPAAKTLGRIGDKRAVKPLLAFLDRPNYRVSPVILVALTQLLGDEALPHVKPFVRDWGFIPEYIKAISRIGWKPANETEEVYLILANGNDMEILNNWQKVKPVLLKELRLTNSNKNNQVMYILLRLKKGDGDVISALLNHLERQPGTSITVADVYLNCGHQRLEAAAEAWAKRHGYHVFKFGMPHIFTSGVTRTTNTWR